MSEVTFRVVVPGADVFVTLELFEDGRDMICGLRFMAGTITLGPKAMRAAMLTELAKIEQIARVAGCSEMRHAGEDRAWCLPGYEPMSGLRNGRRKRL